MPRARSPNRNRAKELWLESGKKRLLKDIAAELRVPENRIRKWKAEDKWEYENFTKPNKTKETKRSVSKGKAPFPIGAPKGNINALGNPGGGAPLRNQNSTKHGIYSKVFWDTLDDQEREMIDALPEDESRHLFDEVRLLTVRERRLMQMIREFSNAPCGVFIQEVSRTEIKREFSTPEDKTLYDERQRGKIDANEILPGHEYRVGTTSANVNDLLLRAHAELTRVQSQKGKILAQIHQMGVTRERFAFEQHRLNLVLTKIEVEQQAQKSETDSGASNFLEAMMDVADKVWGDDDNSDDDTDGK